MPFRVIDRGKEPNLSEFDKRVGKALMKAAEELRRPLATPPTKVPGTKHLQGPFPGGFYSMRQRQFVLSNIRMGTLQIPYLRTADLERSWSISMPWIRRSDGAVVVTVYSDEGEAPYNEWVQQSDSASKRQQVAMHKDWLTPEEAEKQYGRAAMAVLMSEVKLWGFR